EAMKFANELRAAGIRAEPYLNPKRNIGKQVQYADRKGARVVAFLGSDEIKAGQVSFKRLSDGTEVTAARANAAQTVRDLLAG
ncbi:MAG: histidine--tRNA ligase, partial [Anaerolineae bacterium]|nr:histidine--tRNA ligase [Anaerolineae bacterium]